jgi:acyl-CoA synthetase (AMP-forming)/AMP-acid ligase II
METPLTPLEFARRSRKLYPEREAVVDGDLRLSYEQFFDRCDAWSAALQALGVKQDDRVAYIAPNTHAQLESFYAVPQIGAVLVPLNYRLTADDFAYLIQHSGARVVCAGGWWVTSQPSAVFAPVLAVPIAGDNSQVQTTIIFKYRVIPQIKKEAHHRRKNCMKYARLFSLVILSVFCASASAQTFPQFNIVKPSTTGVPG